MRLSFSALLAAVLSCGELSAGEPPELHRTFWVDLARTDLNEPAVVKRLLQQPINRLVVPVLTAGQTPFPTVSAPFAQLPRYRNKPDPLPNVLKQAKEQGVAVWFAINCLRWADADTPAEQDILAGQPELAERDHQGGFGRPADGKYASPFHPRVREALRALVQEIAAQYPTLDGIVLECSLPASAVLGYSAAARAAYRAAKKQDLPDWPLAEGPEGAQQAAAWLGWRTTECTNLIRELSSAYRAKAPRGHVAATGWAGWHRAPLAERLAVPSDWLTWVASGAIEEVFLDGDWGEAQAKNLYWASLDLVRRARKPVRLSAILRALEGQAAESALQALLAQNVAGIVVRPGSATNPDAARSLLTETLPHIKPTTVELDETRLKADPRLHAPLTQHLRRPSVGRILSLLREATGLSLSADDLIDPVQPAFDSLVLQNEPAWRVMVLLARSEAVSGHWIQVGSDYHLLGSTPPHPPGFEVSRSPWRLWLAGISTGLLVVLAAILFSRRLRTERPEQARAPSGAGSPANPAASAANDGPSA
jgi:uncharacterized lipoprotein YddW (UPF0748 family)